MIKTFFKKITGLQALEDAKVQALEEAKEAVKAAAISKAEAEQAKKEEELAKLNPKERATAYAKTDCGWGCEFDDSVSVEFEFSDDIDEMEQQEIRELYYEGGAGWLYDGEHDWQEEDAAVHIIAPYQVSLCDELTGDVIEENVKLRTKEDLAESVRKWQEENKANQWPFNGEEK